jgi:hypothetical protein
MTTKPKFDNVECGDIVFWEGDNIRPIPHTVIAIDEHFRTITLTETLSADDFDQRNYNKVVKQETGGAK